MSEVLRSLTTLFNTPLPTSEGDVNINSLIIPKIQRAYAQGRRSEVEIRNGFISDLFNSLMNDSEKELNFIYGSVDRHAVDDTRLVLLDGQQRLTTLWLLCWYLHTREGLPLPRWMKSLKHGLFYDTRDTTSEFISRLASEVFSFPESGESPASEIFKASWFAGDLHCDPSVDSMIRMIDTIHNYYGQLLRSVNEKESEHRETLGLASRVDNIKFYVQLLENFGLTEDLYIKMNARGLQLRPFENFKADMVEWCRNNTLESFYNEICTLLDRDLTDYFYASVPEDPQITDPLKVVEYRDREFNSRFMRFFHRYFTWVRAIDQKSVDNPRNFNGKGDMIMNFFYDRSENEQSERYLGFAYYNQLLKFTPSSDEDSDESNQVSPTEPTDIRTILKVLRLLESLGNHLSDICQPSWLSDNKNMPAADFFGMTLQQRPFAILGGLFSYLTRFPHDRFEAKDITNLRSWMRVVNNIAENTDIDNIGVMAQVMRQLDNLASLPGTTTAIYPAISGSIITGMTSRAVAEEIMKARYIHADAQWEGLFIKAESHPLLRGSILFFIPEEPSEDMDRENYLWRFGMVKHLFDSKGISDEFRKDALLLRAMVAAVAEDSWGSRTQFMGIDRFPLVQYDGADRSLRNVLSSYDRVRDLIRSTVVLPDIQTMKQHLEEIIERPVSITWGDDWKPYLENACRYLISNTDLYRWIDLEYASRKRIVNVQWVDGWDGGKGQIMAAVPRAWYAKINIDTNRQDIMKKLIEEHSFEFYYLNEKEFMDNFGNVYDNAVRLTRPMAADDNAPDNLKITLQFTRQPAVEIHIHQEGEELSETTWRNALLPVNAEYNLEEILNAIEAVGHQYHSVAVGQQQ